MNTRNTFYASFSLWKCFPCKKLLRCLNKWYSQLVRSQVNMANEAKLIAQFIQLLKQCLCNVQSGIVWRKSGPFLLTKASCRHWSFQCISPMCWACFLDAVVSPGKLEWVTPVADYQTVTMTFFQCKFGFGKCFRASSKSNHWAGHHQLYKNPLSSQVTIPIKKWFNVVA